MPIQENTFGAAQSDFDPVVRHLVLDIMVRLHGYTALVSGPTVSELEARYLIGQFVGVHTTPSRMTQFSMTEALEKLQAFWRVTHLHRPEMPKYARLTKNLAWLATISRLGQEETEILTFCVLAEQHSMMRRLLIGMGNFTLDGVQSLFSDLFDFSYDAVGNALHPSGALSKCGLLKIPLGDPANFFTRLALQPGLGDMLSCFASPDLAVLKPR